MVLLFGHALCLCHPSSAHGFIETDESTEKRGLGLRIVQLCNEKTSFRVKNLNVARIAGVVPGSGEAGVVLERLDPRSLCPELFPGLRLIDEAVFHLPECLLDYLFVANERFFLHCLGRLYRAGDAACSKDGSGNRDCVGPGLGGACKQAGQVTALYAVGSGQKDVREVLCLCHADLRVGGNEVLLGLTDVRPPLKQLRRKARRYSGEREKVERPSTRNRAGVAAQENAQRVLLLSDQLPQHGHRSEGRVVFRLDLAKLQLRYSSPLVTGLEEA